MKNLVFSLAFAIILTPSISFSQKNYYNSYYNEGLKYYNLKEYRKADSLFTISLLMYPHKDAYFNRALCQKKLLNIEDYCYDLSMALMLGDAEALKLYLAECGTIDTVYFDKNKYKTSKDKFDLMEVKINSGFKDIEITYVYNAKNKQYTEYKILDSIGKVYLSTDVPAKHDGSESDFNWLVRKNLQYPPDIKRIGKSVYVKARFIVNEQGKIVKITRIGSSEKCNACITEAEKFIMNTAKWKPGKLNGIAVQTTGFIDLKFDIEKAYK